MGHSKHLKGGGPSPATELVRPALQALAAPMQPRPHATTTNRRCAGHLGSSAVATLSPGSMTSTTLPPGRNRPVAPVPNSRQTGDPANVAGGDGANLLSQFAAHHAYLRSTGDGRRPSLEGTNAPISTNGVWTQLGEGCANFSKLLKLFWGSGFSGSMVIETDVTRQPTALAVPGVSQANLRSLGI